MNDTVMKLYNESPAPVRSAVASIRGYYLRAWRYSGDTERLVAEALSRESWTQAQWTAWQDSRLGFLLRRAANDVPYYRALWAERRRRGDLRSPEYLDHWPVLEKEEIRRNARAFIADDCSPARMFHEHTSGTTGKPLDMWFTRETVRNWYAVFEARWRRWYGISLYDRWAILGGQLVTPVGQRTPPFWVWNAGLRQLYMSSYHLSPEFIPRYLDAMRRYGVRYVWGYSSSLFALADVMLRLKMTGVRPVVAVTNAEPLYAHQREVITAAFGCPVRETYGMTEIAVAAGECGHGTMHLWPEVGFVEILEGETAVPAGQSGDLVCTGLMNPDMPLIRYRVGDRATRPPREFACACGRLLPSLSSIEGRSDDVLRTVDGRPVGRLDTIFKGNLPVREAQIIQDGVDHVTVLYVPTDAYTAEAGQSIVERLRARMGEIRVTLEPVERIPRSANGKFRAVVNRIPAAARSSGSVPPAGPL